MGACVRRTVLAAHTRQRLVSSVQAAALGTKHDVHGLRQGHLTTLPRGAVTVDWACQAPALVAYKDVQRAGHMPAVTGAADEHVEMVVPQAQAMQRRLAFCARSSCARTRTSFSLFQM